MSSVVVGIGCDQAQDLPAEILRYSVELHAHSRPTILKLHETAQWAEMAAALKGKQRTPFSFQRFLLARKLLASSADIGVYVDSDMLVFRPIEELVDAFRETGTSVATVVPLPQWRRRHQSSVMVMDRAGAALLWTSYGGYLDGAISYDDLIYLRTIDRVGSIEYRWNCLEYLDESSALIHYTDMDTQPWLRDGHPNAGIWYTYLWRFAQQPSGRKLIESEIQSRHVRPALREIVEFGSAVTAFSTRARLMDALFVPPHRFRRLTPRLLRTALAPILRALISLQFLVTNGQPNTR